MPQIHKIQSRDLSALTETLDQIDKSTYEQWYLDHLKTTHVVFIASEKPTKDDHTFLGIVYMQWTSSHTQLWQRNIPEILSLICFEQANVTRQLLLQACENAAQERNHIAIAIQVDSQNLASYQPLGYQQPTFIPHHKSSEYYLIKSLT